jgi:hypothetical protein
LLAYSYTTQSALGSLQRRDGLRQQGDRARFSTHLL